MLYVPATKRASGDNNAQTPVQVGNRRDRRHLVAKPASCAPVKHSRAVSSENVYRLPMLENVSVDMVDCARVKDVLEVSVLARTAFAALALPASSAARSQPASRARRRLIEVEELRCQCG